jgi:ABC-2 type transport system ATP-binding protein
MRQKLGIAMAVVPTPRMVVLDEPTTGLDPVSRAEIWAMIGSAAAHGAGVMVNTTYVDEAERGTRVLALEGGAMLAHGSIDEVRRSLTGTVVETSTKPTDGHSWRRGHVWRTWYPKETPPNSRTVRPDLTDLLIVSALRLRMGRQA